MTGSRFLLDTNIISAWLKGEKDIAEKIDKAKQIFIPIIVLGEMHYGAQYSTNVAKNISNVNRLTEKYSTLYIDHETIKFYGEIKSHLRKKGKPIPENDIWIAAIAKQHHLALVTRDKHFKEVPEIKVETW